MINQNIMIENSEISAWKDMYDAAPVSFRLKNGLDYKDIGGGTAFKLSGMPLTHFNRVIGLGLKLQLDDTIINEIKSYYNANEKYILHYLRPMMPLNADILLEESNFQIKGSWERIIRDNAPLSPGSGEDNPAQITILEDSMADSWEKFLLEAYNFDFNGWPSALNNRNGWKHYVALSGNSKIVACRSFFMTAEKTVWSGIEAPVPGIMTQNPEPDFLIWKRAINDYLKEGAVLFTADIELPDHKLNNSAYMGFKELGFSIPYTRFHYAPKNKFTRDIL